MRGARKEWIDSIVDAVRQVTAAIDDLHRSDFIHSDLKPANILLELSPGKDRVHAWIIDFGLAREIDGGGSVISAPAGTPLYWAPEQIDGHYSPQTDIFALGELLYELLTGRRPFPIESAGGEKCLQHKGRPLRNPNYDWTVKWPDDSIPRDLRAICEKAMQVQPDKRYANARLLLDDLNAYLVDLPVSVRPRGFGERLMRWSRKNRLLSGTLAFAVATLIGLTAFAVYHERTAAELNERLDNALEAAELVSHYSGLNRNLRRLATFIDDPEQLNRALSMLVEMEAELREITLRHPDNAALKDLLAGNLRDQSNREDHLPTSLEMLDEAVSILEPVMSRTDLPSDELAEYRRALIETLNSRAIDRRNSGMMQESLADYERALQLVALGAPDEYEQSLYDRTESMVLHNYAIGLKSAGDLDHALTVAERAVEIRKEIGSQDPTDALLAEEYANSVRLRGSIRFEMAMAQDQNEELLQLALNDFESATDMLEQIIGASPDYIPFQQTLLVAVFAKANCEYALDQIEAAISTLRDYIDLAAEVALATGRFSDRHQHATILAQLGELLIASGDPAALSEARQHVQNGLILMRELQEERPTDEAIRLNVESLERILDETRELLSDDPACAL